MILRYKQFCVWPIVIYFFYSLINTIDNLFVGSSVIHFSVLILRAVFFLSLLLGFISIIKALDSKICLYVLFFLLILTINFLIYPTIPDRFNEYMRIFLLICFPLSIMEYYADEEKVLKVLDLSGFIIGYIFFLIFILYVFGAVSIKGYNTSIGYSVILPEMVMLSKIKEKNGAYKLFSIVSLISFLIVVLLFGSRGPIVTIIAFVVYDSLYALKFETKRNKKILGIAVSAILIISVVALFNRIMGAILSVANKFGMHSRTLRVFANDFSHLSGREDNYSIVIEAIKEHPLIIRGIAGDTVITGGAYSHNLVLELICEFGIIFGLIAVIIIVFRIIRSLFFVDYHKNEFLIISLFGSVVPLMFSSTLWMNCIFWMWAACYLKTDFRRESAYDYTDTSEDIEALVDQEGRLEQVDQLDIGDQGDQV